MSHAFKSTLVVATVAVVGWIVYSVADARLPRRVRAESQKYTVSGRYYRLAIPNVAALAVVDDHLSIRGTDEKGAAVAVDEPLPFGGRPSITNKFHLESDATVGRSRVYSFLEKDSLDTFAIWLPGGEAALSFASIATAGRDLLVFASGDRSTGPRSYYGWVAIEPRR